MTHFNNIIGLDSLKQKYKELAKKYHPDLGGDAEIFKEMQKEYEDYFYKFSNEDTKETPSHLINLLNKITFLFTNNDAKIELVGSWLWISFDKKPEVLTIENLKKAGLRWSMKQKKWFSGGEGFKFKPIKTNLSFGEIVSKYGTESLKWEGQKALQN